MFEIVSNDSVGPDIHRLRVRAPKTARKRQAGQFVIVRAHADGERIPLTIADSDPAAGTITLIVQAVGRSTAMLCNLGVGQGILDLAGPLGHPAHIEHVGRVVVMGGGIGTAVAMPIATAMKAAGNEVWAIIGGRSRDHVILEDDVGRIADRLIICTDDGSYGRRGLVTDALKDLLDPGAGEQRIDLVVAVGPVPMMQAVCEMTRPAGIPTTVSLNPIMIDGTGMCGGCRVSVGGKTRFACVDGPEFDGHQVDFTELRRRLSAFEEMEHEARRMYEDGCRLDAEIERTKDDE